MATPIGTNVVTAIARHYVLPRITDNIFRSNPLFFRMNQANKRLIRGGRHIEVPLMYARFSAGGPYRGAQVLTMTPSDTIKNGALDWKQQYVPVVVDGLTMIQTDSPESIANFISTQFAQAEMEMADNLAVGLWSDGADDVQIDGLKGAVDDGTVLATYAGLLRSANTWWKSKIDSTTATLTMAALQAMFGNVSEAGRHPTIIISRQEQYNRLVALVASPTTQIQVPIGGRDDMLFSLGVTNILFNGVPWIVDSHVFDGPNASNSAIVFLNEDYLFMATSPRADFYVEDFQTPINQDAMASKLLWAGNLVLTNCARHGKLTNVAA